MQETLRALFRFSINNENNEHQTITLFSTLEEDLIAKIKLATDVDLTGFCVEIDNYGIKHAFDRHGNENTENKRGQVAITENDFCLVPMPLLDFDTVRYDFRGERGKPNLKESLVFEKYIDNQYIMSMEVRKVTKKGKQNKVVFQTLYIKKLSIS